MSSLVFCLPRLKRKLARARSGDNLIVVKTCDGSNGSDEMLSVEMIILDRRRSPSPLALAVNDISKVAMRRIRAVQHHWSTVASMVRSNWSCSRAMRSHFQVANPSPAIAAALPSPTTRQVFLFRRVSACASSSEHGRSSVPCGHTARLLRPRTVRCQSKHVAANLFMSSVTGGWTRIGTEHVASGASHRSQWRHRSCSEDDANQLLRWQRTAAAPLQ